jgi:drug/metabolite transporter (DMT)-like permease
VVSSAILVGEAITSTLVIGLVLIISGVTVNLLSDGMDVSAALPDDAAVLPDSRGQSGEL